MSEAAVVPADAVTAGVLLRQARENAGLHVATLAANLKVPVPKLEALESDRYDLLPDAVFVRALASSVCRTLKMDPRPVLERLPQTVQPRLVPGEGLNAPFEASNDGPPAGMLDQVPRPVALTVAALLLGALVLVFLPHAQRGYETAVLAVKSANAPAPAATGAPAGSPSAASVASAGAEAAPAAAPAPVTPAVLTTETVALPSPASLSTTPAAAVATPAPPAASIAADAARGIVVFRTRGQSWVQVTDASGTTVLRKLMESGETAGVSGTLPLSVTVGSVASTEVEVRGKPYNLAPVSKDNVARFEIK